MKQINDIRDILHLPYCSVADELGLLPQESGVYFVVLVGEVIYIGRSQNLRSRWVGHHRLAQVASMGDAYVHYLIADNYESSVIEVDCIKRFEPALNCTPVNHFSIEPVASTESQRKTSTESLVERLSEIRGKAISKTSFYEWLSVCGIQPKGRDRNAYTEDERKLLESLAFHLRDGYSYKSFAETFLGKS